MVESTANALDLGSDGRLGLKGTSISQDDKDFFGFTVTPTTSSSFSVPVQSSGFPAAKLEVEYSQGNTFFATEPKDSINSGSFQVATGSTYFIRLGSPDTRPVAYLVDLA